MVISLNPKNYTIENALTWGYFGEHCKKAFIEKNVSLGVRFTHGMIAVLELLPIISQIVSLFEKCIFDVWQLNIFKSTIDKPITIVIKSPIKYLNIDFFTNIISLLSLKNIGALTQIDQFFSNILKDKDLWKSIALNQKIQLDCSKMHPREQVKNNEEWMYQIISNLKGKVGETKVNFLNKTEEQIEKVGGICLIDEETFDLQFPYTGVAVQKDNGNYFLHFCTGYRGVTNSFSLKDFDNFMPTVIKRLIKYKITPNKLSFNSRSCEVTFKNFFKWQRNHQKS
ncbi:MAG: hypothetical protein H0T62_13035 [Parachlamydiaceae bacterium]|nr:hypothetical protein [Parachlamydiaceae bacterium]